MERPSYEQANLPANVLLCHICQVPPTSPVATSCGHLFCWPCLYLWLNYGCRYGQPKPCPVCRTMVRKDTNIIPIFGSYETDSGVSRSGDADDCKDSDNLIPPRPISPQSESPCLDYSNQPVNSESDSESESVGTTVELDEEIIPQLQLPRPDFPPSSANQLVNPLKQLIRETREMAAQAREMTAKLDEDTVLLQVNTGNLDVKQLEEVEMPQAGLDVAQVQSLHRDGVNDIQPDSDGDRIHTQLELEVENFEMYSQTELDATQLERQLDHMNDMYSDWDHIPWRINSNGIRMVYRRTRTLDNGTGPVDLYDIQCDMQCDWDFKDMPTAQYYAVRRYGRHDSETLIEWHWWDNMRRELYDLDYLSDEEERKLRRIVEEEIDRGFRESMEERRKMMRELDNEWFEGLERQFRLFPQKSKKKTSKDRFRRKRLRGH